MNKIKERGEIYTPSNIVNTLLDISKYQGICVLEKHVIDNSCGCGNILMEIVKRYCNAYVLKHNNTKFLKQHLETYIHGIEIDEAACKNCINNLNDVVNQFNLKGINWDIKCNNSLLIYKEYTGKMDYVIGNPPYVNIHNFKNNKKLIQNLSLCDEGMSDLYIAFFDIGIQLLNKNGTLCYITPNTFLYSKSGRKLRRKIIDDNLLSVLLDFGSNKVFNASTYTCITLLKKQNKQRLIEYFKGDFNEGCRESIHYDSFCFDKFLFPHKEFRSDFIDILNTPANITVKNGLATLNDSFFIRDDFGFMSPYIIPCIKASKGIKKQLFFPYTIDGEFIDKSLLSKDKNLSLLLKDNYEYGRTQAIKDVYKNKIYINNLISDISSIKIGVAKEGTAVYSGFYILTDYSFEQIEKAVKNNVFIQYIKVVGQCRSGGYNLITTKDLSRYLTWYFNFT